MSPRVLVLALGGALLLPGCYRRTDLTVSELAEVEERDATLERVRVYPSRSVIVVYEQTDEPEVYSLEKKRVRETSKRKRYEEILTRSTPGLVIDSDELNGMRLLFVTFDPGCDERACAYQFVENVLDEGVHDLVHVPEREEYDHTVVYADFIDDGNVMELGRIESLSEPNAVYVRATDCGRPDRVHLQLSKKELERVDKKVRTLPGVE